jgi:type I site-specific restriction-modification system R (restriction) subunit
MILSFGDAKPDMNTDDIIALVDEAHRTQEGDASEATQCFLFV